MSEQYPADDDTSFFDAMKTVTKTIATVVGAEDDDADQISTVVGAGATMFRAIFRS